MAGETAVETPVVAPPADNKIEDVVKSDKELETENLNWTFLMSLFHEKYFILHFLIYLFYNFFAFLFTRCPKRLGSFVCTARVSLYEVGQDFWDIRILQ